jgi:hypothetical protein
LTSRQRVRTAFQHRVALVDRVLEWMTAFTVRYLEEIGDYVKGWWMGDDRGMQTGPIMNPAADRAGKRRPVSPQERVWTQVRVLLKRCEHDRALPRPVWAHTTPCFSRICSASASETSCQSA